jgi:hypothetical protein
MNPNQIQYFSKQTYTKPMTTGQATINTLDVQDNVRDMIKALSLHFEQQRFDQYKIELDNGTFIWKK